MRINTTGNSAINKWLTQVELRSLWPPVLPTDPANTTPHLSTKLRAQDTTLLLLLLIKKGQEGGEREAGSWWLPDRVACVNVGHISKAAHPKVSLM